MISPIILLILAQRLAPDPCMIPTSIERWEVREERAPVTGTTQWQHYDVLEVQVQGTVYQYVEMRLMSERGVMEGEVRATSLLRNGERVYATLPSDPTQLRSIPAYCALPIVSAYP